MPDNVIEEAISESWVEEPHVETTSLWYKDGENTYPKAFVKVNGVLFTPEDARELRKQLNEKVPEP